MKKIFSFLVVVLVLFLVVGCSTDIKRYIFSAQGVDITLRVDESLVAYPEEKENDSQIAFFDAETNNFKGIITVTSVEGEKTLGELGKDYFYKWEELKKTAISEKLVFAEDEGDGRAPYYYFVIYDRAVGAVVTGRFDASENERNDVMLLASSIYLGKISQIS